MFQLKKKKKVTKYLQFRKLNFIPKVNIETSEEEDHIWKRERKQRQQEEGDITVSTDRKWPREISPFLNIAVAFAITQSARLGVYSSVVEQLPSMCGVLDSIPSTTKQNWMLS
jgi:hypothetical protein